MIDETRKKNSNLVTSYWKIYDGGMAREMAQQLKVLAALTDVWFPAPTSCGS